ncbi:MAG: hypothetical protein Q7T31_17380, partial [Dietzia sp.]|nr:hypothetical protein [Dietzia sp.]
LDDPYILVNQGKISSVSELLPLLEKVIGAGKSLFIISEDVQMGFAEQSFPPVLSSIYDDEALQQEFPYMPALKAALENAEPRPVTPYYPAVSKAIQDNTFAALRGEKNVEQALTDMSAAIDQAAQ